MKSLHLKPPTEELLLHLGGDAAGLVEVPRLGRRRPGVRPKQSAQGPVGLPGLDVATPWSGPGCEVSIEIKDEMHSILE